MRSTRAQIIGTLRGDATQLIFKLDLSNLLFLHICMSDMEPPRYRALAAALRQSILDRRYQAGSRLPTEAELAQTFGVSRGTVVRAVALLVAEGLVTRRQGSGSFVALPSLRRSASGLVSFSRAMGQLGLRAGQRVLSFREATRDEVRAFGAAEPSVRLERMRFVDGVPCALHCSILPQRIFDALPAEAVGSLLRGRENDFSLYAALEAAGIRFEHGEERVSGRLARAEEAELLHLETPAALIVVVRQTYDSDGRWVEATEALYPAGFYTYEVELRRGASLSTAQKVRLVS
jgi:GntR family transcriptional regulator